jgi:formylglycine-generating enzyme required for sulfatase activity
MNLTSQYVANPKSVDAYLTSLATYKSIRPSNAKLRLGDDRQVLNDKKKYKIFRVEDLTFKTIICPRGIFMMGSNPKRLVLINKPFLLGETEVTQELFKKVMGVNPSEFQGDKYQNSKKRPVENITWYDAVMFCNKLSEICKKKPYYNISNMVCEKDYVREKELPNIAKADVTINPHSNGFRLPFEKEWEYAAKAGTNNQFAGTNDPNEVGEVAWFGGNSKINGNKQTHPVKGKRPNEWGFYDMSGNVEEWCWDREDASSARRVSRGGSWYGGASYLHSAFHSYGSPGFRDNILGFRVSASLFN